MPSCTCIHLPQLDGIGSQHREAQGEESKKFKSYFDKIVILSGGYVITNNYTHRRCCMHTCTYCAMTMVILSRSESGFNHVEPEQYKHRLLHFKGTTVYI